MPARLAALQRGFFFFPFLLHALDFRVSASVLLAYFLKRHETDVDVVHQTQVGLHALWPG